MKDKLNSLIQQAKENNSIASPVFYRLRNNNDKAAFEKLLANNTTILVYDELISQVEEFVKSSHPKKVFTPQQLHQLALEHIGNTPVEEYGVWVYYPWSLRLVHMLDEEEFVAVRTNRNTYKITPSEKKFLADKKIGIIGLSVGQSIALTIAMERICGELRLADFDLLEMSNLNRIRAGVQNLGLKKTVVATREIMEIDPFLKVTCYNDGLTEENVDDFFTKDGRLDVCIEVCDGLYAKIFARLKAKQYKVAVVMNSSDRGTTDIERYDLDPNLPILHGLIDHLDLTKVKEAKTNEEKVPYLLPMLGVRTSTNRLRASMLEIQETITTWPQLASGVILGGGICSDICRRLLLGEIKKSGRYFVDLEDLINDNVIDFIEASKLHKQNTSLIPNTGIDVYAPEISLYEKTNTAENTHIIDKNHLQEIVKAATLAPSGGNIQPWKWIYKKGTLFLFIDPNRSNSILNFDNTAAYVALGAATENVLLKAEQLGYTASYKAFPLGAKSKLVAVFSLSSKQVSKAYDMLVNQINLRVTNRTIGKRDLIKEEELSTLRKSLASVSGAQVTFFTNSQVLDAFKEILCEVDRLYLTSEAGNHAFTSEIRWTKEEAEITKDGIDIETMDITPTEFAGLTVSSEWQVTRFINEWGTGTGFSKITAKGVNSASALGVIIMPKGDNTVFFEGGRAVQRVWLSATSMGLAFQPMSILVFLFTRLEQGNFDGLEKIKDELLKLRERFINLCGLVPEHKEIFFFRLSQAGPPKVKSLRRPLEDVFIHE